MGGDKRVDFRERRIRNFEGTIEPGNEFHGFAHLRGVEPQSKSQFARLKRLKTHRGVDAFPQNFFRVLSSH